MSSSLLVGAIAFGKSGIGCPVTQVEGDRVTVLCSDGKLKRVPLNAIARWEMPGQKFKPCDRVTIAVGNPERFRHHGKVGTIRRFDPKDSTFEVQLDDGGHGWWRSEFLRVVKHE
ncbi:hypothetical protein [Pseudanabaena sp. PCC 6802]|uniref:hypothetical protein n=1 Tax=Pseudanabaena sp. PCC 6802 TaxID=118173 RepID=UPI0003495A59|nr:hypothetical protein [Pseudanabaena sp. PCC 6802]